MIFVVSGAFGQQKGNAVVKTWPADTMAARSCWGNKVTQYYRKPVKDSLNNKRQIPFSFIPAGYYSDHLGFFCKQEIKFAKATRIPFKFRLGSVQYCDWMEGKPNAIGNRQ